MWVLVGSRGRNTMHEVQSTEIAGTEIEIGDVLQLPISRQETVSHLEVIGIEETDIESTDDTKVYLKIDDSRYTLSTADAIAFAVLSGGDLERTTEILAVEKPESLQIPDDQDGPNLEDMDLDFE